MAQHRDDTLIVLTSSSIKNRKARRGSQAIIAYGLTDDHALQNLCNSITYPPVKEQKAVDRWVTGPPVAVEGWPKLPLNGFG